jgi:O-antigen/teichoic acid export membrane protein
VEKKVFLRHHQKESFDSSLLWKSCEPLWIVAIMNVITTWGGQFIAGYLQYLHRNWRNSPVARNTTVLVSFIQAAINNVSAPRFAVMYNQGKMNKLKNYARNTTRLMTLNIIANNIVYLVFSRVLLCLCLVKILQKGYGFCVFSL